MRDGGDYVDEQTGETKHFEGQLFDSVVFNDSVKEFLSLKTKLGNYFDENQTEDIFDYIPPQKTNQIYTPKKVVIEMVDMLEQENPNCFDDENRMVSSIESLEKIKDCLKNKKDFVLNGGAGSGKTYSLVETIKYLYEENKNARIACITYTNIATNEIKNRIPNKNLWVSTIHDFLWENIKSFQKNLKSSLIELIEQDIIKLNSSATSINFSWDRIESIQYKEYRKLQEGIISHNDILTLSHYIFNKYPLLSKIVADKFQYIFIDEYQDTNKQIIENFIDNVSTNNNVIGLFGDSMQAIYSSGIGDVNSYIECGKLVNIKKDDNFRCSINVIKLINKLRTDLYQEPAKKDSNKNILNKVGTAKFIYSNSPNFNIQELKSSDIFKDWNFNDTEKTKELYLTHRLIAIQNNFQNLFAAFYKFNKDKITGDDKDNLLKHILRIQNVISLYDTRNYSELMKNIDIKIVSLKDKAIIKEKVDALRIETNKTIEDVIKKANTLNLIKIDDNIIPYLKNDENPISKEYSLYCDIKDINFSEVVNFYNYDNNNSIYSTQHGVKGAEFENVLIILDNGKWNQYNFEKLFTNEGNENVIKNTLKIFYVGCSRAENNLAVFYYKPSLSVIAKAKELFGSDNVIST